MAYIQVDLKGTDRLERSMFGTRLAKLHSKPSTRSRRSHGVRCAHQGWGRGGADLYAFAGVPSSLVCLGARRERLERACRLRTCPKPTSADAQPRMPSRCGARPPRGRPRARAERGHFLPLGGPLCTVLENWCEPCSWCVPSPR